jgi:hypothetical protein
MNCYRRCHLALKTVAFADPCRGHLSLPVTGCEKHARWLSFAARRRCLV